MLAATLLLLADLEIAAVTPVKDVVTSDETFRVAVRVHNRGPEAAYEQLDAQFLRAIHLVELRLRLDQPDHRHRINIGPIIDAAQAKAE